MDNQQLEKEIKINKIFLVQRLSQKRVEASASKCLTFYNNIKRRYSLIYIEIYSSLIDGNKVTIYYENNVIVKL